MPIGQRKEALHGGSNVTIAAGMGSFVVMLLALGIVIAGGFSLAVGGARVSARDVAWIAGTPECSPAEADVYSRYLQRHRLHRLAGGLFGTLFAITVGGRWYGSVSIGVGPQSPLADVLFCGLGGLLVGAFSAESFRLSEPRSATVSASLTRHAGAVRPELVRVARGISLASLVGGGLVAATGHGFTPLGIAIGGLMQHSLRRRPSPRSRADEGPFSPAAPKSSTCGCARSPAHPSPGFSWP